MQTVTTLLRAAVMICVLAIAWKAWQIYGPTDEQLCEIGSRVVEIAREAFDRDGGASRSIADPRLEPAPLANAASARDIAPRETIPVAAELLSVDRGVEPAHFFADEATAIEPEFTASSKDEGGVSRETVDDLSGPGGDPLEAMISGLKAIGVRDPRLEPWGSSGELYRFSCRVPWGEAATFTRHFESVAAEPIGAVEAVVEKVDAWRLARNGVGDPR